MNLSNIPSEELRAELKRRAILKAKETREKNKECNNSVILFHGIVTHIEKYTNPWFFSKFKVTIDEDDYYKYYERTEYSEWRRQGLRVSPDPKFIKFKNQPKVGDRVTISVKLSKFKKWKYCLDTYGKIVEFSSNSK